MTATIVTADSQAILLLCSTVGLPRKPDAPKPLSRSEWNTLARALDAAGLRPAALIGLGSQQLSDLAGGSGVLAERLGALLDRGAQLAIELDRLAALGIWTLARIDERYPPKVKDRLKAQAPPVLFGAGLIEPLDRSGVAVVGSREVDDAATEFARTLGRRAAESQLVVFSGGARGVDRLATNAALEAGGTTVAVLAESLEQTLRNRETRNAVLNGRATLVTPSHPAAGFTVGSAMGRNKIIYALSDWACVVSSDLEEGGTWTGAVESLQAGWVPLFVRQSDDAPEGNRRLLQRGGLPLKLADLSGDLGSWFARAAARPSEPARTTLFVRETAPPPSASRAATDLFHTVWPLLEPYLSEPRTEADVASAFSLTAVQAKAWLARAVEEGRVLRSKNPARFRAVAARLEQHGLFDAPERE